MSWDADLTDDHGNRRTWNYTHNCNAMANTVLYRLLPEDAPRSESWWRHLDGLPGLEGAALLDQIVRGLEADPARFRAMHPDNGWGDYDSFLNVLTEMRDAVPNDRPSTWRVYG